MEQLCAEALQAGIETDFVRRLVGRYSLNAPSPDVRDWPWQVKIFALGRFEVHCNDVPLEFSSKTPKRPLALMKMIVASGADGVSERRVLDALWPDDDPAHNAFGVALVRLRKLLGSSDTVLVKDQRLSLNPRLCWVDAWAFERFASDAERRLGNEGAHVAAMADRAVELYRGSFLPSDSEEQWTLQTRLRMRSRFTRFMETLGEALEHTMQWQRAIDCYYRGLEADDLIEEFYLGLMRCYRARGRAADGIAVFRRMRQTLSVVLNVAPSPAAEALAKELREAGVG
jgi:DNA-binding SARP family transcriptional activator